METNKTQQTVTLIIRLALLFLIVGWSLALLSPFSQIIIWSVTISIALGPTFTSLKAKLGGRGKLAAGILVILALGVITIPTWLFLDSIFEGIDFLKEKLAGTDHFIPLPNESVREWPLIGEKLYAFWLAATQDLQKIIIQNKEPLIKLGKGLLKNILGVGGGVLQIAIATLIAGVVLVSNDAVKLAHSFMEKILGNSSDEYIEITQKTVISVIKGVIGVAVIQSVLIGIGFLAAGVPYAGLWTLIALIIIILQLPPILVVLPAIFYILGTLETGPAIFWVIYLGLASISDNLLKPILLGKGAPVPMLVILLGVLGGFMMGGFIGMFTGAIFLSLGYRLFISWVNTAD